MSKDKVGENAKLLGLMLQSDDMYMMQLYIAAAVSGSSCICGRNFYDYGKSEQQRGKTDRIFRYAELSWGNGETGEKICRREALNWCKTAIPADFFASFVIWGICALLRVLSPGYFKEMPVFAISLPGLLRSCNRDFDGTFKRLCSSEVWASKVSPLTAVSGNAGTVKETKKPAGKGCFPVEISLGIHHAKGSRKNLFLMTVSFGFSIVLFLAFGTTVDFMNHALKPLQPNAPDISVFGENNTPSLPKELAV